MTLNQKRKVFQLLEKKAKLEADLHVHELNGKLVKQQIRRLSYESIARAMGINPSTLRSYISRSKK